MRKKAQEKRPEGIDADGDGDGINHRREKYHGGVAVQKLAHAEISIDAAREREHAERDARGDLEALHAFA